MLYMLGGMTCAEHMKENFLEEVAREGFPFMGDSIYRAEHYWEWSGIYYFF